MEQLVQLIFDRAHWNHIDAANDNASDRRGEGHQDEEQEPAAVAHHCELSSVEGASASRASKGDSGLASADRVETAEPAIPMNSAVAAAMPHVIAPRLGKIGRASCRERVCQYV